MEDGVGRTLREARTRRKIDLAEVEAATKIRSRYLRAIENEEWDLLPGETYTRAFIRAYAGHLGLDGERLAEEQRRRRGASRPGERLPRVEPAAQRTPRRRRESPVSPRLLAAIVSVAVIVLLVVVGLSSGGGGSEGPSTVGKAERHPGQQEVGGSKGAGSPQQTPAVSGHTVSLTATAEVWVCLLDGKGEPLIDGQILGAGSSEGPYRSGSFTLSLGNGEVTMKVDGEQASIPETSSPVGYSIGRGTLQELSEGERPTCT